MVYIIERAPDSHGIKVFVGSSVGQRVVQNRKFLVPNKNQILAIHSICSLIPNLAHERSLCMTVNEKWGRN